MAGATQVTVERSLRAQNIHYKVSMHHDISILIGGASKLPLTLPSLQG